MVLEYHTVDKEETDLFMITDSFDHVIKLIKASPVSEWWKMMD